LKLADLVPLLAGHRILVVGDLVLDEYLTGRASRVSREAPVLVLDEVERECRAGSAGNPAANVVALGSQATIVGAVGTDTAGERLRSSLAECGIDCAGLVRVAGAATATKTRVLAQGYTGGLYGRQQVLRVDRVPPLPPEAVAQCAARMAEFGARHDAVLISDYRGGVVADPTVAAARSTRRPITVDSQGELRRFRGVDLVKINQAEAQAALGSTDVLGLAGGLRRELEMRSLVVTLGAEGMAVFAEEKGELVRATRATEVFDVTGAGDTVIAVLTLGLVAGIPLRAAAQLANAAASIVVRRLGVASVSPRELAAELGDAQAP
jgi:D-glycero-beta-D-manno-heptose-7-phosphate kinase